MEERAAPVRPVDAELTVTEKRHRRMLPAMAAMAAMAVCRCVEIKGPRFPWVTRHCGRSALWIAGTAEPGTTAVRFIGLDWRLFESERADAPRLRAILPKTRAPPIGGAFLSGISARRTAGSPCASRHRYADVRSGDWQLPPCRIWSRTASPRRAAGDRSQ